MASVRTIRSCPSSLIPTCGSGSQATSPSPAREAQLFTGATSPPDSDAARLHLASGRAHRRRRNPKRRRDLVHLESAEIAQLHRLGHARIMAVKLFQRLV